MMPRSPLTPSIYGSGSTHCRRISIRPFAPRSFAPPPIWAESSSGSRPWCWRLCRSSGAASVSSAAWSHPSTVSKASRESSGSTPGLCWRNGPKTIRGRRCSAWQPSSKSGAGRVQQNTNLAERSRAQWACAGRLYVGWPADPGLVVRARAPRLGAQAEQVPPPSTQNLAQCGWHSLTAPWSNMPPSARAASASVAPISKAGS